MKPLHLVAVTALALSLTTPARAITDNGGKVWTYAQRAKNASRINYTCKSACTLALSNPRTCVGPDAVFVFHAVSNAGRHNRRLTQWLIDRYPTAIRSWIRSRGGLTSRAITLRGAEMLKRVRRC